MIQAVEEFHYKIPGTPGGYLPGAHRSHGLGPGLSFAAHRRLFDYPDPRRLDLRASLKSVNRDWLVRANRQHSSVTLQAIVDVSASMHFAGAGSKLGVVGQFLQALGVSAFRHGDAVSLLAFDQTIREDLYVPPRTARGIGITMADVITGCRAQSVTTDTTKATNRGLLDCAQRIARGSGLVFLLSDFHWALDELPAVLDQFEQTLVVPLVIWDSAEINPPAKNGWLTVSDAETGRRRDLWLRETTRRRWLQQVAERRDTINSVFGKRQIDPVYFEGHFDAEKLTRYFMEHSA